MTASIRNRLLDFSIEATPAQWRTLERHAVLPQGRRVYVPALPKVSARETMTTCASIRSYGFEAVPHLAARAMQSRAALSAWLQRMADTGADSLLLIAGDRARAAGPFGNTLAVLDSGLLERYGFRKVGVAGHPEGHRNASRDELVAALRCKLAYARDTGSTMWIVTQFVFSAAPIMRWYEDLATENIALPLCIGMSGPAKVPTLLRYAVQCGVGVSMRMLTRRPDAVAGLLGRWTPDHTIATLESDLHEVPHMPLAGLHVFPFGGLQRSIEFFTALRHDEPVMLAHVATGS